MAKKRSPLTEEQIDALVAEVNAQLKAARVGITVWRRGRKLSLRGKFPPGRPGATGNKTRPYHQMVSLDILANPAGIEQARLKAMEWGTLLAQQRFRWTDVLYANDQAYDTCGVWVERFKEFAVASLIKPGTPDEVDLRWKENYFYPALGRLKAEARLTELEVRAAAMRSKPNTRARQICCQRLTRFAKFAGLEVDLSDLMGSYSTASVRREIPSDEAIAAAIDAIQNPEWQFIAGAMATWGLRNHEAFLFEPYEDSGVVYARVPDGTKTEFRENVPPLPGEWVERWQLMEVRRPKVTATINKVYGDRVSTQFFRMKVPFKPYSLRHAYAIRGSLQFGFPTAVMAKWLGHDPNVYLSIYQRHISGEQSKEIYRRRIAGDR